MSEQRPSQGEHVAASEPGPTASLRSAEEGDAKRSASLHTAEDTRQPSGAELAGQTLSPEADGGRNGTGGLAGEAEMRPGIWSRQKIKARAESTPLITDENGKSSFNEERLDPASYRLSVGRETYISPVGEKERASVTSLKPREGFFIPPGQFAFLITEEVVKVPPDAFAFIAMRTRIKFKGLVNVSGFHADPGYDGRLIFAVFNAGPGDVHLRRGDELFTISFASLDEKTSKPRPSKQRVLHIPSEIITPIAGQIQSLAGLKNNINGVEDDLSNRLHAVEREVGIFRWALPLAVSLVVALLVRLLSTH